MAEDSREEERRRVRVVFDHATANAEALAIATPGEWRQRAEAAEARVTELEERLLAAEAGWTASQHALRHAHGEPCPECEGDT
jgi:hypothetical protein